MADFMKEENEEVQANVSSELHEKGEPEDQVSLHSQKIDVNNPVRVLYCAVCSMPPEYCEYGTCYDRCLPWIQENCPEILGADALAESIGKVGINQGEEEEVVVDIMLVFLYLSNFP